MMEPTARGDQVAADVRKWYERHRETWWERCRGNPRGRRWEWAADEFMLRLVDVAVAATAGHDVNDGTWDY